MQGSQYIVFPKPYYMALEILRWMYYYLLWFTQSETNGDFNPQIYWTMVFRDGAFRIHHQRGPHWLNNGCVNTETRRYTCALSVSPWNSASKKTTSDPITQPVRTVRLNELLSFLTVCVCSCVGRYTCTCRCGLSAHVGICIWEPEFDKYLP